MDESQINITIKRQQSLEQVSGQNHISIKTILAELNFKEISNSVEKSYDHSYLIIKIRCQDEPKYDSIKRACYIHEHHLNPYFQQFHRVSIIQNELKIQVEADLYRYSLRYIVKVCESKNIFLAKSAGHFIIFCLIQMYKYILYLIQTFHQEKYFGLVYDLCLDNLGISQDYKLILLNSCITNHNLNQSIRMENNRINSKFRRKIVTVLKQISPLIKDFSDYGLINNFEQYHSFCSTVQEERMTLMTFEKWLGDFPEIPEQFYQFLKQNVETTEGNDLLLNHLTKVKREGRQSLVRRIEPMIFMQ